MEHILKKWEMLIPWKTDNSGVLEISRAGMVQLNKSDKEWLGVEFLVSTDNSVKIRLPITIEVLSLTDLGDCYLRKHLYLITRQLADRVSPVRMIVKGYSKLSKDMSNESPRKNSIDEALSCSVLYQSPVNTSSLPSEELVKSKPNLDLQDSLDMLLAEVGVFLGQSGIAMDDPRLKCLVNVTVDEVNQAYGILGLTLKETDT